MKWVTPALVVALLGILVTSNLASGGERDMAHARALFAGAQRKIKFESGADHIKLGIWCRDAGLPPQATAEFLRAVEVTDGELPIAVKLVDIMRTWGDKFWKYTQKKPKAILDTYEKKVHQVEVDFQRQRLKLARDAIKADLLDEGYGEYCAVVRLSDGPLTFDDGGQVVIDAGKIPLDISTRMKADAITIKGKLYLRDDFLLLAPHVKELSEADGEHLRVRVTGEGDDAAGVHEVASALMPLLEDDVDGRPTRKLQVFVFKDRASYGTWCDKAGRAEFKAASGFADGATYTAVVCAEKLPLDQVRGMCMHELAHLYQYAVTPVVMPSWYAEGFAESWGGDGTFEWKDGKLKAGGMLSKGRLDTLRAPGAFIPLEEFLKGRAIELIAKGLGKGMLFYTQSWAFLRYMRTAAPADVQTRFKQWEAQCKGAALGAKAGKPREEDTQPANAAFISTFGKDLPAIEKGFKEWLAKQ